MAIADYPQFLKTRKNTAIQAGPRALSEYACDNIFMSLRDLLQALKLTQDQLAGSLGIGQDGISRLEKRSDLLLSTLRGYVEAMGGHLELIAEFPNRPPVVLSGLAAMETVGSNRRR